MMRRASVAVFLGLLCSACYTPTVARNRSYHPSDADLSITRIVHGSVIVDFRETRILVDPWFNPTPPLGPSETTGLPVESLPPLRGILITHKHDDHFDEEMLQNYSDKQARVVVPRNLGDTVRKLGYADVVEVDPWEQAQIGSVIVKCVPARHRVPECGYVLQANGTTAYIAGDTTFDAEMFGQIAAAFPRIDVALLPAGGIRILGRKLDMSPEEAARAFALLQPAHVIPYHYGLTGPFPFVTSVSDASGDLADALKEISPAARAALVVLAPGESWHHYR